MNNMDAKSTDGAWASQAPVRHDKPRRLESKHRFRVAALLVAIIFLGYFTHRDTRLLDHDRDGPKITPPSHNNDPTNPWESVRPDPSPLHYPYVSI
jgi:hypothetical protein